MNILLVTANTDLLDNFVIILKKLNYNIHLLMPFEQSIIYGNRLIFKHTYYYDLEEMGYNHHPCVSTFSEKFIDLINNISSKTNFDLILPADNSTILTLAKYRDRISDNQKLAIQNDYDLFLKLNDKWQFYQECQRLNLPTPQSLICKNVEDVLNSKIEFPLITKPLNHGNGLGVMVHKSNETINKSIFNQKKFVFDEVLLQKYIDGTEYQLLFLANRGEMISYSMCEQISNGSRVFKNNELVIKDAKTLIKENKYHGVGQIDVLYDKKDKKHFFIEINLRFPASSYYHYLAGHNHLANLIKVSTNQQIEQKQQVDREVTIKKPLWVYIAFKLEKLLRNKKNKERQKISESQHH